MSCNLKDNEPATSSRGFLQDPPLLGNQFTQDPLLSSILKRGIGGGSEEPSCSTENYLARLNSFGDFVVSPQLLTACAKADSTPPRLETHDVWGKRVDRLILSPEWQTMKKIAAEEGIVSRAYNHPQDPHARLIQFAKYYLFAPSSAIFTCPLAMTDGAARVLELHLRQTTSNVVDKQLENAFNRLVSTDSNLAWTSGQWMTERPGGSDVRNTETLAFKNPDPAYSGTDEYLVSGFKWFTSATDSEMTLLLAKINSHSAPLSLFFAETKDPSTPSGLQAGIKVQRLKNKYGTKALPTAELELTAIKAKLIGQPGRGVATISALLNITRIHTAVNSVAFLRRALAINHSFAGKRKAFGKLIKDQPLHAQTLLELETTWKACMLFTFHVVSLLGRSEYLSRSTAVGKREDKRVEGLLRMLTLVVKAWVSKECNAGLSEAMEAMGGQGYMEEVDIGRLLRDCQVNCIWEGTTNILSLDLRKVVLSNPKLYVGLLLDCIKSPLAIESSSATFCCETHILAEADRLLGNETTLTVWLSNEANARKFLYQIGQLVSASLMISHFRYFDGGSGCGEEGGGGLSRDSIHYWCCLSGRFTSTHNARL